MSSGCGDVLSLADLQTAKKHQLFEAEVITGLQGGVTGGTPIDYATNQVTGQVQKTLPAVLRDAGFSPASFTFQTGGTLSATDRNKVVYDSVSMAWYSWKGTLPKTIPAGTNPLSDTNWVPQTDPNLRTDLASNAANKGASLVGTTGGVTVQQSLDNLNSRFGRGFFNVKDYGAVGNGVADDTTAIQSAITAAAAGGTLYFPHGTYLTTQTLNLAGKKMRLLGDGINQTIIKANATITYLLAAAEASTTYSFNEFSVEGIQFDGNLKATTGFNLAHRHYCSFRNCAFFNNVSYAHVAANSWLNNYDNCVFGASPNGVALLGSNHRNSFNSCSWIGNSTLCLSIADGVDGNSAITFNNCDFEFQNGAADVNAVYIASNATFSFNDCYVGENINGTLFFMDGNGLINIEGGVIFNGVSANSKVFRTSNSGEIHVRNAEIIGGSFASIASLGNQFGSKFSLQDCRLGFATLGIQTLAGEGLNRKPYSNPVISNGKGWTLDVSNGTATQTVNGTARTCTVTAPSSSGLMFLTSALDQNKLSSGLGSSGRFSRVIITYQSNTNANVYTVNTSGGAAVNNLGALPLSPSGKSVAVIAADITGGSLLEIAFSTGSGAVFTLYDATVIDASDCTLANATMTNLFKAK